MAARAGIEPASAFLQAVLALLSWKSEADTDVQHSAQIFRELATVAMGWRNLPVEIRLAVLALVKTGAAL